MGREGRLLLLPRPPHLFWLAPVPRACCCHSKWRACGQSVCLSIMVSSLSVCLSVFWHMLCTVAHRIVDQSRILVTYSPTPLLELTLNPAPTKSIDLTQGRVGKCPKNLDWSRIVTSTTLSMYPFFSQFLLDVIFMLGKQQVPARTSCLLLYLVLFRSSAATKIMHRPISLICVPPVLFLRRSSMCTSIQAPCYLPCFATLALPPQTNMPSTHHTQATSHSQGGWKKW